MTTGYRESYVFYCHSILMNGHSYKFHGLGGSESALTYMAQEMAKCGKDVLVFCKTEEPGVYEGVRYERLEKFLPYIQFNIIDVFISVRSVDVFFYDIKARLKVLWLHDAPDQPHLRYLDDARIRRTIDCYITISEWQKRGFIKKFKLPAEKILASRNGINRKFYKILRANRRKRLVYTSTPFRGLEILLEMFPEIRRRVPDVELYVYSSMAVYGISREEDRERFGKLYESCQQPGVTLMGSYPQQQLARELMRASVFVYPNIFYETSCIAALEGQAAGLPVVASKRGALAETVVDGRSGILIDAEITSAEFRSAFVEGVVALLTDKKRWRSLSETGRERVMRSYCWDIIAREWVTFFDEKRPTLSLCMIVRDEEANIKRCINSVAAITDEIIVVDTGSRDRTKHIARSLGASVFTHHWNDDFSAARNFALSKATSDWILVLDADEVLGKKDLQRVRQLLNVPEAYAYLFFQWSYLNDTTVVGWKPNDTEYEEGQGHAGYFSSPITRLFRNHCGFQFEGKVHEIVEYSILRQKKTIINTDIPIHHYGKVRDREKMVSKGSLYLEIGKARVQEHPRDSRAFFDLGAQYFELGGLDKAKECYLKALDLDADDYRASCDLGMIYAKEKKLDEAMRYLERAVEINPRYVSAYTNLGIAYEAAGRSEEAIKTYKKTLALDAHNVHAYKSLGLLYFSQNKNHDALECFRKVQKLDSSVNVSVEHATASYRVGLSLLEANEITKAKRCFEEAIRVLPSFPLAYSNLGIIYANAGDMGKAEEMFKMTITLTETNKRQMGACVQAHINLGFIYNNTGAYQKALSYLEKALEMDPTQPDIYNHIGIAKCGMGNLAEGATFFEMALRLNPQNHAAQVNLKRVQEVLIQERNYKASSAKE